MQFIVKAITTIASLYSRGFSNLHRDIWIFALAMFINRSGSVVLIFTSLYLTNELHFSIGQAGLAMSFYGAGSILGSLFGGWLADRRNYLDIMVGSLLLCGIILPGILLTNNLYVITAVIFSYAFIADMFRPAMSKGIILYSTPENRTRSVSLIRLAINLGFSVAPPLGGFIAFYLGYKPLMIIDAATSILAGVILVTNVKRKSPQNIEQKPIETPVKSKSAYRDFEYLFFILFVSIYGICFFQIFASVPQYLDKVWHYDSIEIGLILLLNGSLVVLIEMPLMVVFEKHTRIFKFITLGALCTPVSLAILLAGQGVAIIVVLYTLIITLSEILAMPFMMNFTLSRPKQDRQGEYAALYSVAFGIANIMAPIAGLKIAEAYGFNNMFYLMIGLGLISTVGFWILKKRLEPNESSQ